MYSGLNYREVNYFLEMKQLQFTVLRVMSLNLDIQVFGKKKFFLRLYYEITFVIISNRKQNAAKYYFNQACVMYKFRKAFKTIKTSLTYL